jgi:hypothetical protein
MPSMPDIIHPTQVLNADPGTIPRTIVSDLAYMFIQVTETTAKAAANCRRNGITNPLYYIAVLWRTNLVVCGSVQSRCTALYKAQPSQFIVET